MKKIAYIILIILLSTITSCGVSKTFKSNNETKKTETTEVKKDSSQVIEKNKEINNEYTIPLRTADSLTNDRIREALLNFKAGAKSGSNSTKIVFDEDALAFKIASIVGETQDKTTNTNSDTNKETSFEQRTDEYIEKKFKSIPFWVWILGVFYFLPAIISRVQMIINPLSLVFKKLKS